MSTTIPTQIAQVFQDSQTSIVSHRKQIVILKQLQDSATESDNDELFNRTVMNMLNKVLTLKKSEVVGDRIIKFISLYCQTVLQNLDDTYTRFVDELVMHSMKGIEASNKNVRYRCLQLLNHLLFQIDEISNDIYETLMDLLSGRLHDKDSLVRAAAVRSLSRFQESEQTDQVSELLEKLLIAIQNDTSADVRKLSLLSLEKNKITLNYLLERARDVNVINRRLVFTKIMKDIGDFRSIDFRIREKLLTWGLKDRDPTVCHAASKMFAFNWFQTCNEDFMELIGRLHVIQSDIAEVAVKVFFKYRPEIFNKISFSEELWKSLNPESAFLIRCYFQYCNENSMTNSLDKNFPESMELANLLSKYLKLKKIFILKNEDESNLESLEFVIQQLLIVAKDYDYSDEVGRREMFQILRSSLINDFLSDKLIKELLKVLRKISVSERDFCQMITEVVTDIRDSDDLEEEFHSAVSDIGQEIDDAELERPLKKLKLSETKLNETTLQCLIITKRMLELTTEPLKDLFAVQSLLFELINPSVHHTLLQIRSLLIQCLGLVCLIDKELAGKEMFLMGLIVSQKDETLKITALKVIFDILSVHGTTGVLDIENGVDSLSLSVLLYKCLKDSTQKESQAVTLIGICKLYLADILIDNELFETLLLSYFGPDVSDNEPFKQALSFCIPVYSFSHQSHQEKVMKIASDTFVRAYQLYYGELDDELKLKMTTPAKILEQMIHFTDPANIVNQPQDQIESSTVHAKFGLELIELVNHEMFVDDKFFKKIVITSLLKLKFTQHCDIDILKSLKDSIDKCEQNINDNPIGYDLPTKNSFFKFKLHLEETISDAEKLTHDDKPQKDESDINIDLAKLVEEEIERSMVEPKEDESDEDDEVMEFSNEKISINQSILESI